MKKKQVNLNGKVIEYSIKPNGETQEYQEAVEEKEVEPIWKRFEKKEKSAIVLL